MLRFFLYSLLTIVVFLSICTRTVPCKEEHMKEIEAQVSQCFRNGSMYGVTVPDGVIEMIEKEGLASGILRQMVVVEEHGFLSIGKIVTTNDEYLLSLGILGNVIVLPKEGISEKMFLILREKKIID